MGLTPRLDQDQATVGENNSDWSSTMNVIMKSIYHNWCPEEQNPPSWRETCSSFPVVHLRRSIKYCHQSSTSLKQYKQETADSQIPTLAQQNLQNRDRIKTPRRRHNEAPPTDIQDKWVKNLSHRSLMKPKRDELAKGLNFTVSDFITATESAIKNKLNSSEAKHISVSHPFQCQNTSL